MKNTELKNCEVSSKKNLCRIVYKILKKCWEKGTNSFLNAEMERNLYKK